MNDWVKAGRVAVITGAALGIGRALSQYCAAREMHVVMCDLPGAEFDAAIEQAALIAAKGSGQVVATPVDVTDASGWAELARKTRAQFSCCHLLVNNAVTRIGRGLDADLADWRKAVDTNVFGPIMGVRAFLDLMLETEGPRSIVNVGSKQGITNPPGHPIYNMCKSALKTYTEALEHELRNREDNQDKHRVSAHLLVPGWTTTGKAEHKPGAWLPEQVVERLFDGLANGDFYIICPDDEVSEEMDRRRILYSARDLTENRPALSRWHPDYLVAAKAECS